MKRQQDEAPHVAVSDAETSVEYPPLPTYAAMAEKPDEEDEEDERSKLQALAAASHMRKRCPVGLESDAETVEPGVRPVCVTPRQVWASMHSFTLD